jgi:hypothetical protein
VEKFFESDFLECSFKATAQSGGIEIDRTVDPARSALGFDLVVFLAVLPGFFFTSFLAGLLAAFLVFFLVVFLVGVAVVIVYSDGWVGQRFFVLRLDDSMFLRLPDAFTFFLATLPALDLALAIFFATPADDFFLIFELSSPMSFLPEK